MIDPLLVATIAKIQDDLTYVIEELLRGHGGEARSEMNDLLGRLEGQVAQLGEAFAGRLRRLLEQAFRHLEVGERSAASVSLIDLRRGLRNLQLRMQGQHDTYPYGEELGWPGVSSGQAFRINNG